VPRIVARLLSCSAPATISEAEAESAVDQHHHRRSPDQIAIGRRLHRSGFRWDRGRASTPPCRKSRKFAATSTDASSSPPAVVAQIEDKPGEAPAGFLAQPRERAPQLGRSGLVEGA